MIVINNSYNFILVLFFISAFVRSILASLLYRAIPFLINLNFTYFKVVAIHRFDILKFEEAHLSGFIYS